VSRRGCTQDKSRAAICKCVSVEIEQRRYCCGRGGGGAKKKKEKGRPQRDRTRTTKNLLRVYECDSEEFHPHFLLFCLRKMLARSSTHAMKRERESKRDVSSSAPFFFRLVLFPSNPSSFSRMSGTCVFCFSSGMFFYKKRSALPSFLPSLPLPPPI
jgi:hypothetical protein